MKTKLATRALVALFLFVTAVLRVHAQTTPTISNQPQSVVARYNTSAVFSVDADGDAPLDFQWFNGSTPTVDNGSYVGSKTPTLTVKSAAFDGSFTVVITNAYGSITSSVATLNTSATILSQPVSCATPLGSRTVFSASANGSGSGTATFGYQWQLNGTNISGAKSSAYTIANIHASDLGTYNLIVTNSFGSDTSSNAMLAVGPIACWGRNNTNQCSPPLDATNVSAISTATQSTSCLTADGQIISWGKYASANPPLTNAVQLSTKFLTGQTALADAGVALRSDGTPIAWGFQPGFDTPPGLSNIVAVSDGNNYRMFLRRDGTVYDQNFPSNNLTGIIAIDGGATQNLALRNDGTVLAWRTFSGQATNVPAGLKAVAIASGYGFCLAINTAGRVVAWGSGPGTNLPSILTSPNAPRAVAISASGSSTTANSGMALLTNGTVVAWGDNTYQQSTVPPGLSNVVAISAGMFHNAALVNDGGPLLLKSPVGGSAYVGRNFLLSSPVTGQEPLSYQWTLNGTNMPDATNATLLLTNVQLSDAGTYQLTVTKVLGTATSVPVPVQVVDGPLFLSVQPSSQTAYLGRRVNLGVPVNGSGPVQIQWRYSPSSPPVWQDIPGATNEDLTFDPVRATNAGIYSFVASNSFGSLTSSNAVLGVRQVIVWGNTSNSKANVPSDLTNAIAVATGNQSSLMALRDNGTAVSWGYYGVNSLSSYSNLVEIGCDDANFVGLQSNGKPFTTSFQFSNRLAGLSNIVAIETDASGSRCLRADGIVTYVASDFVRTAQSNVVAMGSFGGNGYYLIYADGHASYSYVNGVSGTFQLTNAQAVAGGSTYRVALSRDSTITSFGTTVAPMSNVIAVAGTELGSLFAMKSDGTVTNWASTLGSASKMPADLYSPLTMEGGYDHVVAMYSASPLPTMLLPQALDIEAVVVSSEHSAKWYGQTNISHDGNHAARSGQIGSNTASSMRMLITNGPVIVSYWWKVSSETNHDLLTFAIGGVPQSSISGEVDWQQATFTVPAGPQMLVWTYSKDASGTSGLDAGFVDQLTITPIAPSITAQPTNTSVNLGSNAVFSVTATGTAPLTYNWRFNGTTIVGATNRTYTITNAQPTNVGTYSALVSNVVGAVTSSDATLSLNQPPSIDLQPESQTIIAGSNTTLSVTATGTAPLFYQWLLNSAPITGATNSSLSFSPAQQPDAGSYTVTVSNMAGSVTSTTATLVVYDPVVITTQPQSQTISQNTPASFSVAASGTAPIQYQWRFNGIDIADATNTSYSLSSAQITNSGSYSVVITNIANSVTSADAVLVVNPCAIHVIDISTDTNEAINITWSTDPGITYTIQSKTDVTNSQWSSLTTSNATSTTLTFTDTATNSQQFYRLISDCTASEVCGFLRLDLPGNSDTIVSMPFLRPVGVGPDWTPNSIFPNGAGINTSPTLGNRNTEILMPDLLGTGINLSATKIYFFHGGVWKQVGQGNVDHGTDTIAPNTWFIVRHNVATNTTLIAAGIVDQSRRSITLRTDNTNKQDNIVALMRPVTLSLNDSELISSGAFALSALPGTRTDELLTFDNSTIAKNKSASGVYYYWSNAWRRVGSGTNDFGTEKIFSPGTGVIIRKSPASTNATWTNSPTY